MQISETKAIKKMKELAEDLGDVHWDLNMSISPKGTVFKVYVAGQSTEKSFGDGNTPFKAYMDLRAKHV